jgi:ADP-ribose pyrophosphatase
MQMPNCIATRQVHKGRVINVTVDRVDLPNGRPIDLDIVHHPGAAAVVPVDDNGDVHLVRQVRYAAGGWLLEVPAGKLEPREDPAACARREMEEETGVQAQTLIPMGFIWTSPGFCNEKIWLYLATGLTPSVQALDDDEVLTVVRMPLTQAIEQATHGEIEDGKSVCALLRARAFLQT